MTRLFLLFLIALVCAPAAFAQNNDYSRYEFYVGYAYQRANNNADTFDRNGNTTFNGSPIILANRDQNYNGFTAEFNQNITRHVGIVTSFTATFDKSPYVNTVTGRSFSASAQRYDVLIGPRYNWRLSGVTPFVEALFGIEHVRVKFSDTLTNGTRAETAFAMGFGGGLDVHAGDHVDIRAVQVDYLPTFFNSTHQNNFRVGAGVKIK